MTNCKLGLLLLGYLCWNHNIFDYNIDFQDTVSVKWCIFFVWKSFSLFLYRKICKWMTFISSCSVELRHIWQLPNLPLPPLSQLSHFSHSFLKSLIYTNKCLLMRLRVKKTVQSALLQWFLLVILDGGDRCRLADQKSRFLSAKLDHLNVISALPVCLTRPPVSAMWSCFFIELKQQKVTGIGKEFFFSFSSV